jgi:hypothetical protein
VGEVLDVADVLDGGEGEGEALRKLDAAHDGKREQAVDEGHEPRGAEEQQDGGDGEPRAHDLRHGELRRRQRDGRDGFHRLHGHRDAEEHARGEVVERGEDESGAEVEVRRQRQRQNDGDVGAQVAHRAAQLRLDGRLEADGGREEPAPAALAAVLAGEERIAGPGRHGSQRLLLGWMLLVGLGLAGGL